MKKYSKKSRGGASTGAGAGAGAVAGAGVAAGAGAVAGAGAAAGGAAVAGIGGIMGIVIIIVKIFLGIFLFFIITLMTSIFLIVGGAILLFFYAVYLAAVAFLTGANFGIKGFNAVVPPVIKFFSDVQKFLSGRRGRSSSSKLALLPTNPITLVTNSLIKLSGIPL